MFSMASVAEEDQLDRDAARKVLRRAWDTLGPYRRQLRLAVAMIILYTLTILAGPYLVKVGIDRGIKQDDGRALNLCVAAYVVIAFLGAGGTVERGTVERGSVVLGRVTLVVSGR